MIYKDELIHKPEVYAYALGAYLSTFPGKLFQRLESMTGFNYQILAPVATILVKDGDDYIQYYIQSEGELIVDKGLSKLDFENLNALFSEFTRTLLPIELDRYINNSVRINLDIENIDYRLWLNVNA